MNCADHITDSHNQKLGYLDWHHSAELSNAKGERQERCTECSRWYFPWERSGLPSSEEAR
jgi:hypothetical protein